jgi:Holliday junction DNA helicase RuvB
MSERAVSNLNPICQCEHCGGGIEFEASQAGRVFECPHCGKPAQLPGQKINPPPDTITPNYVTCRCQHCDGHIEFDASGFREGENVTVNCPHCQKDTVFIVPPKNLAPVENLPVPPVLRKKSKWKSADTYSVPLIVVGIVLIFTCYGAIIGFPILIWGIILNRTKSEKEMVARRVALAEMEAARAAAFAKQEAARKAAFFASPEYYIRCLAVLSLNERTTPPNAECFIGQDRVKAEIRQAYETARGIGRRSPHILMVGEKGMGKSTLALLIARTSAEASGTQYKVVDAQRCNKPADLAVILSNLESGDALFIDNIDKLDDETKFLLKSAIVDFKCDATFEDEAADDGYRTVSLKLPLFTFIATTTKKDELSPLLIASFPLVVSFDNYSVDEITAITKKLSSDLGVKIDADAIQLIGTVAKSPWFVAYLIELVRVYAEARETSARITLGMTMEALKTMARDDQDDESNQRVAIPSRVRDEVWRRDEGKCVKCGSRVKLEFDHIVPVSKGGSNTARNIELLCEACNRAKSDLIQ